MIELGNKFKSKKIVIAVSGGIDSMVLFHLLKDSDIIIAHVNHNVRKESKVELEYLEDYCSQLNIRFESITLDYTENEKSDNFQKVAREKRYNFFFNVVDKYKADYLALAHHGDDLIETVLMSLSRGSGLKGYGGFSESSILNGYNIIRPLIRYNSEAILGYAKSHNIKYFEDSSNKSTKYTRNRYRKEILPFLKLENPNIHHKYLQYSNTILDAYNYIYEDVNEFLKEEFSIKRFSKLKLIVQKEVISTILSGYDINISNVILDNIITTLLSEHPNQEITLSNEYILYKEYDSINISRKNTVDKYSIIISDFGEFKLPNGDILIVSEKRCLNNKTFLKLCYNNTVFPIIVRNRIPGDKIKLDYGTKKIKDLFIDLKIPKSKRNQVPLILVQEEIIWIPGIKQSVLNNGENFIYLEYKGD
ncbi:tRNA lysidine(34) synthetase TilS [Mycoplasmatota bacterium WC44]